jgi:hypothetical protein
MHCFCVSISRPNPLFSCTCVLIELGILLLQVRCQKQGQALWSQITPASVFSDQVYIADDSVDSPEGGSPRSIPQFAFQRSGLEVDPMGLTVRSFPWASPLPTPPPSPTPGVKSNRSFMRNDSGEPLRALWSQASLEKATSLMMPAQDDGNSGAGGANGKDDATSAARTADDLMTAALMMRC